MQLCKVTGGVEVKMKARWAKIKVGSKMVGACAKTKYPPLIWESVKLLAKLIFGEWGWLQQRWARRGKR